MSYNAKEADKLKYVEIEGERFKRIKMGDKGDLFYGYSSESTCGDCGAHMGHYHMDGCDLEVSPKTGDQLLGEADYFSTDPFDVTLKTVAIVSIASFTAGVALPFAVRKIQNWRRTCKLARLYKQEHGIR